MSWGKEFGVECKTHSTHRARMKEGSSCQYGSVRFTPHSTQGDPSQAKGGNKVRLLYGEQSTGAVPSQTEGENMVHSMSRGPEQGGDPSQNKRKNTSHSMAGGSAGPTGGKQGR